MTAARLCSGSPACPPGGGAAVWRLDLEPGADHTQRRALVHARAEEVLAGCLGVSPARIRIVHRPGVPPSTGLPGWSISLSYARGLALIAVANGARVGVDVVALDELGDEAGFARDYLDPHERMSAIAFAAGWAAMEASAKCLGVGLREHPRPRAHGLAVEAVEVPPGWVARLARHAR